MGINTIEREGISYTHPAQFTLIGTMNPEEGDLRPQFLDRFGLVVDVCGEDDTTQRMEVIKRRLAYESEPKAFISDYMVQQNELSDKIMKAKNLLPHTEIDDSILEAAAKISIMLDVDGHRADIVMIKTAMTIAAFDGRIEVTKEDLLKAAELSLPHRMRCTPFDDSGNDFKSIFTQIQETI